MTWCIHISSSDEKKKGGVGKYRKYLAKTGHFLIYDMPFKGVFSWAEWKPERADALFESPSELPPIGRPGSWLSLPEAQGGMDYGTTLYESTENLTTATLRCYDDRRD